MRSLSPIGLTARLICYNFHCSVLKRVGEWLSLVEHLVRDQGVGGSNPLSPTISFQPLAKSSGHEGLHKRVYIHRAGCWPGVNSRQTLAAAKLTASTRSSHHVRL